MKQLSDLKNVGKATLKDLHFLGIHTVEELSNKDPTTLFHELERRTNAKQDPCVWDVFAAIIHEASGGEPTVWWEWTCKRKALQKKGLLNGASQSLQKRCFGFAPGKEFYADYHDKEWGVPVYEDRHLFEMLILEGAQAGLSWETILKRRKEYQKAFYHFDPAKVAKMTDDSLDALLENKGIIRNRLKIYAARQNALIFLKIQKEFGSFSNYVWNFVDAKPIVTRRKSFKDVPTSTPISDALSKDLKKRGMAFVGTTIIYAFMQAVGLVDDHLAECWCAHR